MEEFPDCIMKMIKNSFELKKGISCVLKNEFIQDSGSLMINKLACCMSKIYRQHLTSLSKCFPDPSLFLQCIQNATSFSS